MRASCPTAFALYNDREKDTSPRRAAPFGASCENRPLVRPFKVVAPKGAARRRLGSAFAFYNGSILPLSAPKSECDARPNLGAECPLLLGAARRRWRLVVPCSSQRWLCRVPLGGVGVVPCSSQRRLLGLPSAALCCALPFPNGGFGDFPPPRPIRSCLARPQKLPLLVPSGAGRGLKVCSSCRRCVLRASNGFSANDGGDAGGDAAQNRARHFSD